ncbi:MAG: hypothetical protein WDW36_000664 [Sanguina aurantia]
MSVDARNANPLDPVSFKELVCKRGVTLFLKTTWPVEGPKSVQIVRLRSASDLQILAGTVAPPPGVRDTTEKAILDDWWAKARAVLFNTDDACAQVASLEVELKGEDPGVQALIAQHCALDADLLSAQEQLLRRDAAFRAVQDEQYMKWTLCGNSIKGELRKARGLDAADLQQVTTVKGEPPVRVQVYPRVKPEPPSPTPTTALPSSTAAGNLPSIPTASPHLTPRSTTSAATTSAAAATASAAAATTSATGQGSRGTAAVGSNSRPISVGESAEGSEDEESDHSSRGDPEEYDVDDASGADELASAVGGERLAGAVKAEPMDTSGDGGASLTGFGVAGGGGLQKLAHPSQLRGCLKREQSDTGSPAGAKDGEGGRNVEGGGLPSSCELSEAIFNSLADPAKAQGVSAGSAPIDKVYDEVPIVLKEVGIDYIERPPQMLTMELTKAATLFITMGCGESCPYVPGLEKEDWVIPDPHGGDMETFRTTREFITGLIKTLIEQRGWGKQ